MIMLSIILIIMLIIMFNIIPATMFTIVLSKYNKHVYYLY